MTVNEWVQAIASAEMTITDWIQAIASAVNAVLVLVLVGATIYYARKTAGIAEATKLQANEMKKTREFNEQPELAYYSVPLKIKKDKYIYIPIQNVGNGPARQVKVECLWKGKYYVEDSRVPLLGRDHRNFLCVLSDDKPDFSVQVKDEKDLVLRLSYFDLNKKPIKLEPVVIPYEKMKAHRPGLFVDDVNQ